MSQWTERFENHPVHQQLQTLKNMLTEIDTEASNEPSPEATESIERLKQIEAYTEGRLRTLDPFLVPSQILNNINAPLQQVVSFCSQYQADKNVAHLASANDQADGVLIQLGNLLYIGNHDELQGLSESIISFRRSVGQYHRYVDDEREGLVAPVRSAKKELEELETKISAERSRLDGIVNGFQQQFSESEERRRNDFTEEEKDRERRFRELQETRIEGFEQTIQDVSQRAETSLQELSEHEKRAQELVYVISNTGMVGGYQKIADTERTTARVWQFVAVIGLLGLIGFAVFTFFTTLDATVSWQTLSARTFVAFTFGALAAYAARQASKHEVVERSSRNLELALASVDPYLVSLPEKTQHQVKKELAMRFFGREPSEIANQDDSEEASGTSEDMVRAAVEGAVNGLGPRQA